MALILGISGFMGIASFVCGAEPDFSEPVIVWNEPTGTSVVEKGRNILGVNVGGTSEQTIKTITFMPLPNALVEVASDTESVTLQVEADELGQFDDSFTLEGFYPNNPEMEQLFNSGAVSHSDDGWLRVHLRGLTAGQRYYAQFFHFQPGVPPGSRRMTIRLEGAEESGTPVFTYHDPGENVARNAVRVDARWTALSPETTFLIKSAPGFNRAVLNAVVLQELP